MYTGLETAALSSSVLRFRECCVWKAYVERGLESRVRSLPNIIVGDCVGRRDLGRCAVESAAFVTRRPQVLVGFGRGSERGRVARRSRESAERRGVRARDAHLGFF